MSMITQWFWKEKKKCTKIDFAILRFENQTIKLRITAEIIGSNSQRFKSSTQKNSFHKQTKKEKWKLFLKIPEIHDKEVMYIIYFKNL